MSKKESKCFDNIQEAMEWLSEEKLDEVPDLFVGERIVIEGK